MELVCLDREQQPSGRRFWWSMRQCTQGAALSLVKWSQTALAARWMSTEFGRETQTCATEIYFVTVSTRKKIIYII